MFDLTDAKTSWARGLDVLREPLRERKAFEARYLSVFERFVSDVKGTFCGSSSSVEEKCLLRLTLTTSMTSESFAVSRIVLKGSLWTALRVSPSSVSCSYSESVSMSL